MAELESAQPREDDPFFEENFNHCTGRFSTAVTVTARVAALGLGVEEGRNAAWARENGYAGTGQAGGSRVSGDARCVGGMRQAEASSDTVLRGGRSWCGRRRSGRRRRMGRAGWGTAAAGAAHAGGRADGSVKKAEVWKEAKEVTWAARDGEVAAAHAINGAGTRFIVGENAWRPARRRIRGIAWMGQHPEDLGEVTPSVGAMARVRERGDDNSEAAKLCRDVARWGTAKGRRVEVRLTRILQGDGHTM
ncbi:hypothetical protein B0H13DRAFT_2276677 [Mycena leptocephala]|nr:hypothetical protein B0H13DRAFT_2276677 [Mycena leptocephala]